MSIIGVIASSAKSVPSAPTIGTATDVGTGRAYNNGAATVTFTAPTFDGKSPITSYTVTSSPGGFTASGASSPITVTGLASSTSYTFTVTATNAVGTSAASSASNSITATTVPQAPTIGTASSSTSGTASITFTANATGGKTVSTYTATSSPGSITGSSATSPISVTGLTNGTSYTFTVTATNANGTSAASAASNSVTPTSVYWIENFNATTYSGYRVRAVGSNIYFGMTDQNGYPLLGTLDSTGAVTAQKAFTYGSVDGWINKGTYWNNTGSTYVCLFSAVPPGETNYSPAIGVYNSSGTLVASNYVSFQTAYAQVTQSSALIGIYAFQAGNYRYGSSRFPVYWLWNGTTGAFIAVKMFSVANKNVFYVNGEPTTGMYFIGGDWDAGVHANITSSGNLSFSKKITNASGGTTQVAVRGGGGNATVNTCLVYDTSTTPFGLGVCGFNNAGNVAWKRVFNLGTSNSLIYNDNYITVDSNNNSYGLVALNNADCLLFKYNSSGVLQWQRVITSSYSEYRSWQGITNNGTDLFLSSSYNTSNPIAMRYPMDGSVTGTYTLGTYTVTIAAGAYSESAATYTITDSAVTADAGVSTTQAAIPNGVSQASSLSVKTKVGL